jgi:hypothetical protein
MDLPAVELVLHGIVPPHPRRIRRGKAYLEKKRWFSDGKEGILRGRGGFYYLKAQNKL